MMLACSGPETAEVDTGPTGPNYALIGKTEVSGNAENVPIWGSHAANSPGHSGAQSATLTSGPESRSQERRSSPSPSVLQTVPADSGTISLSGTSGGMLVI